MSHSGVQIRSFKPEDSTAVKSLIESIMNQEFPQSKVAYPVTDLSNIQAAYGNQSEGFFVATENNHVIGTVAVKKEDDRIALLRRLFVSPAYRNKKIGVQLLEYAVKFCKEHGYQEMVFRTSGKMDGAISLCKRQGFHQRAKLDVGGSELLKFVLFLGDQKA